MSSCIRRHDDGSSLNLNTFALLSRPMRILVADGLEAEALAKLRAAHHVDDVEADPKPLLEIIPNYDALIVRSRTKVTAEGLANGPMVMVVGREGLGLVDIDVKPGAARLKPALKVL